MTAAQHRECTKCYKWQMLCHVHFTTRKIPKKIERSEEKL